MNPFAQPKMDQSELATSHGGTVALARYSAIGVAREHHGAEANTMH